MADDSTLPRTIRDASHIVIAARWGNYPADSVLAVAPGLLEQLAAAGVSYREATEFERRIGGFAD